MNFVEKITFNRVFISVNSHGCGNHNTLAAPMAPTRGLGNILFEAVARKSTTAGCLKLERKQQTKMK